MAGASEGTALRTGEPRRRRVRGQEETEEKEGDGPARAGQSRIDLCSVKIRTINVVSQIGIKSLKLVFKHSIYCSSAAVTSVL